MGLCGQAGPIPDLAARDFSTDAPGIGNSPDPCRAVAEAGLLPKRGRGAPHIGSFRRCLPVTRGRRPG